MPVAARKRAGAARAQATRAKVVAAAGALFVERGYLDTTMADLAAAAGVAVQTLYLSFGSKAAVLKAVWETSGPDHPPGWLDELRAAPDGPAALARHVAVTTAAVERSHPLDAVLRGAAADPEPAELLAAARAAALDAHNRAVDELADKPGFTADMSLQRATDVVATLLAPETYSLLVVEQGWTAPDWAEWALRHLVLDLFPGR
ncbi:MAG TPA: TetR/AcrR family transcriptional regulator [Pseudonocardia sp.]